MTDKPDPSDRSGEQSEKSGPAPNEHLEKTLKALQDKVDSLEKQLQNKRHWTFLDLMGLYSRDCPQKQQGRGNHNYFNQQGNGTQGVYQRRGPYSQNGGYRQSFQGVGRNASSYCSTALHLQQQQFSTFDVTN